MFYDLIYNWMTYNTLQEECFIDHMYVSHNFCWMECFMITFVSHDLCWMECFMITWLYHMFFCLIKCFMILVGWNVVSHDLLNGMFYDHMISFECNKLFVINENVMITTSLINEVLSSQMIITGGMNK